MDKATRSTRIKEATLDFTVVNPDADGIDIVAKMHAVAVPPGGGFSYRFVAVNSFEILSNPNSRFKE